MTEMFLAIYRIRCCYLHIGKVCSNLYIMSKNHRFLEHLGMQTKVILIKSENFRAAWEVLKRRNLCTNFIFCVTRHSSFFSRLETWFRSPQPFAFKFLSCLFCTAPLSRRKDSRWEKKLLHPSPLNRNGGHYGNIDGTLHSTSLNSNNEWALHACIPLPRN